MSIPKFRSTSKNNRAEYPRTGAPNHLRPSQCLLTQGKVPLYLPTQLAGSTLKTALFTLCFPDRQCWALCRCSINICGRGEGRGSGKEEGKEKKKNMSSWGTHSKGKFPGPESRETLRMDVGDGLLYSLSSWEETELKHTANPGPPVRVLCFLWRRTRSWDMKIFCRNQPWLHFPYKCTCCPEGLQLS